jgi:CheY-like chemotaxis protein
MPLTVLVAEDDSLMRGALEALLVEQMGHKMIWSSTAKGAIDFLFTEPIDIAIIDYELDGIMTGLEVAKFIRRLNIKDGKDRKVIILTGHPLAEIRERARADTINALDGVEHYFTKPLLGQIERLVQAVNTVAELKK